MLKVRFELRYDFDSSWQQRCRCKVRILLPAEENKQLHLLLRDGDVKVADYPYPLREWWGTGFDETLRMRVWEKELYADNWEQLEEKVKELVDDTVRKLKEVKERNLELQRTTPNPRVIEVEI